MDEQWKDIPNYPDYQVSNLGQVKSFKNKSPRILKPTFNCYWRVNLSKEGRVYKEAVHKLVAISFIGPQLNTLVRHLDGDVNNNCLTNLSYGTQVDNIADAIAHGTQVRGEKCAIAKLTDSNVIELRQLRADGTPVLELANKYGVSVQAIYLVLQGNTWSHIK